MAAIDWQQHAKLIVKTSITIGPGGGQVSGPIKAEGSLTKALDAYQKLRQFDAERARLIIVGGFHLDGAEIDALLAVRE